jgi:hypothetical protein
MVGAVGEETEAWRLRRRAATMARTAMYTATATHRQIKIPRTAVRIVPSRWLPCAGRSARSVPAAIARKIVSHRRWS